MPQGSRSPEVTDPAAPRPAAGSGHADELALALAAAALGTWRWDARTGATTWDAEMRSVYGVDESWPGTFDAWLALVHVDDRSQVLGELERAIRTGGRYEVRHRVVRPDGQIRWVEGLGQIFSHEDGAVGGSIGCARDITDRVRAERRSSQLQQVTADLASALSVHDLTRLVGRHMQEMSGVTSGGVALRSPDGRTVRLEAWFGYDEDVIGDRMVVPLGSQTPLGEAVLTGRPTFVQQEDLPATYPGLVDLNRAVGSRSLAALPLTGERGTLGALVLGFGEPQPFDDDQRSFLAALAGAVSQAVERSLLVRQLGLVSQELQTGLAPGDLPEVAGLELAACYRPGGEAVELIGGDWFDLLPLPGDRVGVVIGDVMGRGVRASTTMTRMRAAVQALVSVDPDPVIVALRLDRLVRAQGLEDFVTLLYGVLDPTTGRFEYVNAGHLPPLVADGSAVRYLGTEPGPPLGLAEAGRWGASVTVPEGATLLLYTDGLVERAGQDLDDGLDALARAVAGPGRGAAALVTAATSALGAAAVSDDVTVLAVRRLGRCAGRGTV